MVWRLGYGHGERLVVVTAWGPVGERWACTREWERGQTVTGYGRTALEALRVVMAWGVAR